MERRTYAFCTRRFTTKYITRFAALDFKYIKLLVLVLVCILVFADAKLYFLNTIIKLCALEAIGIGVEKTYDLKVIIMVNAIPM